MLGQQNFAELDRTYVLQVHRSRSIVFERGEGVFLWDTNGKRYLDFSAQFGACALGHRNEELIEAIITQLRTVTCISPRYITKRRVELASKLAEIVPDGLSKCWFGNTGSDANEMALKLVKYYKKGGRIVSFWRSYHGAGAGASGASGAPGDRPKALEGMIGSGFVHVPPLYCYRCPFGSSYPECKLLCVQLLEKTVKYYCGADNLSAIVVTPVESGPTAVTVPPPEFLPEIRRICNENDLLLIFDEVVSGMGRTGRMFACEHYNVVPDVLVLGKGMTSGYIPGSAVVVTKAIGETLDGLYIHPFTHCANPITCTAAIKTIEIIERDRLWRNAETVGTYLLTKLRSLQENYEMIGDVRGLGLLIGIEIVKEKVSKIPGYESVQKLMSSCHENGLIVEGGPRQGKAQVIMHPPLILTKQQADTALDIFEKSVREVMRNC
jgi:4-aminobutyrate aminotransferase-like enzyme